MSEPVLPPLHPTGFVKWVYRLIVDIVNEYRNDGVGDLAASITFWTLLSIPAAVLALVSAVSAVEPLVGTSVADDLQTTIQDFVARHLRRFPGAQRRRQPSCSAARTLASSPLAAAVSRSSR